MPWVLARQVPPTTPRRRRPSVSTSVGRGGRGTWRPGVWHVLWVGACMCRARGVGQCVHVHTARAMGQARAPCGGPRPGPAPPVALHTYCIRLALLSNAHLLLHPCLPLAPCVPRSSLPRPICLPSNTRTCSYTPTTTTPCRCRCPSAPPPQPTASAPRGCTRRRPSCTAGCWRRGGRCTASQTCERRRP